MPSIPVIVVVAAVIEKHGRFLLSRRLAGTHLAGLWEFPGGKCEPGETHEASLQRELREELDVDGTVEEEILATEHVYPERIVRLHFHRCRIAGEPRSVLGQELRWATRGELTTLQFPPADAALIEILAASAVNFGKDDEADAASEAREESFRFTPRNR